jgi:putative nucleotidyltransferase with HDIG domain
VDAVSDGAQGLQMYLSNHYDIVITDIKMPKMNGMEMIRNIREHNERQEIIVVSAHTDSEYLTESIQLDVSGYIIKPVDFDQIIRTLEHTVEKLSALRENELYKRELESMVEERTSKVRLLQSELVENHQQTINSLIKMIEGRDTYTAGHSERVAKYSKMIANAMGLSKEECDLIYQAGILHDIGKVVTPDAILLKPGQLTEIEYALIKVLVQVGYNILSDIKMYKEMAEAVYSHHEHYDGSGYPRGLKGEETPMLARIMVVADAFDAMTTSRIYKARKRITEAIAELQQLSGTWYDPEVVKAAVGVLGAVNIDKDVTQDPLTHIDDERFAYFYKDPLTHLYNHFYLDFILQKNIEEPKFLCFNSLYIRNFTAYNKAHGWSEGDQWLSAFGEYLQSTFADSLIFRIYGDDFALMHTTHQQIDIEAINALPMLKENGLYCEYVHRDLRGAEIGSYKDL